VEAVDLAKATELDDEPQMVTYFRTVLAVPVAKHGASSTTCVLSHFSVHYTTAAPCR
jgi:hypothetical protein